ncbi:hypothetical protein CIG75_05665 [Tumebacillus algifaecis]|uniref:Uncharacterized protein n=1 Tax=Tumebacillus algifaecis TaxID=1214604 RepID=A0A223CZC9_9BACL|nr:hypothetical protein [Tumebacillus algifaecis]ASS74534.1 hypothetical protein CIG75_05665 [Tumebacillus algifaecis]
MKNVFDMLQNDSSFALLFFIYYALLPLFVQLLIVFLAKQKISVLRFLYGIPVFLIGHLYLANLLIGLMTADPDVVREGMESLQLLLFAVSFTAMILTSVILRIFYKLEGKAYLRGLLQYLVGLIVLALGFWLIVLQF